MKLKEPVKNIDLENRLLAASAENFEELALSLFHFQYTENEVYHNYCTLLKKDPSTVHQLADIPFLPIAFFKTHAVRSTLFDPAIVFESSGTTQNITSKHFIKDLSLYHRSFMIAFQRAYGSPKDHCIIGLLPSYLERNNSSLVYMVDALIKESTHALSGFYLYDTDKLYSTLLHNEIRRQSTILIGVTYALLDFAAHYPMQLRHTIVMETGGMKGRKKEITREQVHTVLQQQLSLTTVHSEYGMTELLSQAYSKGNGIFHPPSWMKILLRKEDDPFDIIEPGTISAKPSTGLINIIDLANMYSCAFVATDDVGRLHHNGNFEILGRQDNSDMRGCSLLVV